MSDKTICVDFDGVIHQYTTKWQGADVIPDPPVPGALDFLRALHKAKVDIVIHTTRADTPDHALAVLRWLNQNGLEREICDKLSVTNLKIGAIAYLDDRGWQFNGTFPDVNELMAFRPWYKRNSK